MGNIDFLTEEEKEVYEYEQYLQRQNEEKEAGFRWVKENILDKIPPDYSPAKAEMHNALSQELFLIRKWFADNDWKVNKVVIGEWSNTDERWQAYLAERTSKRARQDEILAELGGA